MVSLLIGILFMSLVILPFVMFWEKPTDIIETGRYFNNHNMFAPYRYCYVKGDVAYLEPKQKGDVMYCEGAKREYITIGEVMEQGYSSFIEWAEDSVKRGHWIEVTKEDWRNAK